MTDVPHPPAPAGLPVNGHRSQAYILDMTRVVTSFILVLAAIGSVVYLGGQNQISGDAVVGFLGTALGAAGITIARRTSGEAEPRQD